jgi:hypothetical protein
MTIRFACRCGKKMKTSDDKIGKKILCSACGSPVVVPSGDTVAIEKVIAPASPSAAADTASALLRGTAPSQEQKKSSRRTLAFGDAAVDSESVYDAGQSAWYMTKGFLLPAAGVAVACLLLSMLAQWVIVGKSNLPPLAEVTGAIYLDGVPLPGATIVLRPENTAPDAPKASGAVGRTDENGRFRMKYNRENFGAPLGTCSVQITALGEDGMDRVPLRYRDRTEKREVKDGNNVFDFDMKSQSQE